MGGAHDQNGPIQLCWAPHFDARSGSCCLGRGSPPLLVLVLLLLLRAR